MDPDLIVEKYQAVCGSEPFTINRDVEKLISQGWQPWGSISVTQCDNRVMYAQAMVFYKQSNKSENS